MSITVVSDTLINSCDVFVSGYGALGCGIVLSTFSPMFPLLLFSEYFGLFPMSWGIFVISAVALYFLLGSIIGGLIGLWKERR